MQKMSANIKIHDFVTICRCCLSAQNQPLIMLNQHTSKLFNLCFGLQVTVDDGMPSQICYRCSQHLNLCYTFRRKCLRASEILNSVMSLKYEPECIIDLDNSNSYDQRKKEETQNKGLENINSDEIDLKPEPWKSNNFVKKSSSNREFQSKPLKSGTDNCSPTTTIISARRKLCPTCGKFKKPLKIPISLITPENTGDNANIEMKTISEMSSSTATPLCIDVPIPEAFDVNSGSIFVTESPTEIDSKSSTAIDSALDRIEVDYCLCEKDDKYNDPCYLRNLCDQSAARKKRKGENRKMESIKRRMEGRAYLGFRRPKGDTKVFNDTIRSERSLKPRCKCTVKRTTKCAEISDQIRLEIFDEIWSEMSWNERKSFVVDTVEILPTTRTSVGVDSKRQSTLRYYLNMNNELFQVCKMMYLNTTALGEWSVRNWVTKADNGIVPKTIKKKRINKKNDDVMFMEEFLNNLKKIPSKCRKNSTKLYLELIFRSKADVYDAYAKLCKQENRAPLSTTVLRLKLNEFNIDIYHLCKDQCDVCFQYKHRNQGAEEMNKYIPNFEAAKDMQTAATSGFTPEVLSRPFWNTPGQQNTQDGMQTVETVTSS